MSDDARKLLKLFGVAVTTFDTESEKILADPAGADPAAVAALCRELDARWLEITQHVFAGRDKLLAALAGRERAKG